MHLSRFSDCKMPENKGFVIIARGFCLDFYGTLKCGKEI